MTDNPDYGTLLYELLRKADRGDVAPLEAYLAAEPARAASTDRRHVLVVRHQFGSLTDGRWYPYSAQPDINPWPGSPTRTALVLLTHDDSGARSWRELTAPEGTQIEDIRAEGNTFYIQLSDELIAATGDEVFRVIADCSFAPPGASEAELATGFDKLAGRASLEIVGPREPGALLGTALPMVFNDPALGTFKFWPERPARYLQIREYDPTYSLLADASGTVGAALARAREIIPGISAQLTAGASLVQAIRPSFATREARLISAEFAPDGSIRISIDDGIEGTTSADLKLEADGKLSIIEIDES